MTIDFESHKRERDMDPNRVRCAHCGGWILSREKRCPKCGVHFLGEAFQFVHEPSDELVAERDTRRRRALAVGFVLVLLLLIGTTLFFLKG